MIPESIDKITTSTVQAFIASKMCEGRTVEYKQSLPGNSDEERKEFLADVSSFANAVGGDFLYGITAERDAKGKTTGLPDAAVGVAVASQDGEILRLEQMIRDGIDPRVPDLRLRFVDGFSSGPILIIRIAQSWNAPHVVKLGKSFRFYSRTSAGKYPLDVHELRAAFAASEAVPERMRHFRDERLARIVSGESPLGASKKFFVLHLLPVSAFERVPQKIQYLRRGEAPPLHLNMEYSTWQTGRYNLDGYMILAGIPATADTAPRFLEYLQIFRTGAFEAVASLDHQGQMQDWFTPRFGARLLQFVGEYLSKMREAEVALPVVALASMLGVKGTKLLIHDYNVPIDMQAAAGCQHHPIEQTNVMLPDVLVEDYSASPLETFRPVLDAIWQSCGYPRYFSDERG